ncbi:MAG TPA: DUF1553 domain-containing protein [Pirellulaceae bacterium]|nr:DUF1553 domain-containing protein [Pirellulaceae bacterium]
MSFAIDCSTTRRRRRYGWPASLLLHSVATVSLAAAALLTAALTGSDARADELEFNRDIRPILADLCLNCHGPDKLQRKAELRFDLRESAVEKKAIVPGKPAESQLLARLDSTDPDEVMPPPSTKKKATAAQKAILKKWIESGAEYQAHWAFIPPKKPELPAVKNGDWVRNPIDRFILARLEKAGLAPAPEADLRTLARRVALDLTGLPPDPAAVEALVNDKSPQAYEKFVDTLLKSETWGEHRGRYWLDAARYADTHGIHFDNFREIWAYREWVIKAFNRNLPFDQFTTEQLAGDLLPNRTIDQQIASGFNRCNITTSEGGTIPEEYLVLYTRDRTETVSQVWLGLSAGCAVCHDHKFDPLTQREFYEMAAFFNNTTQPAMDGNAKDTPPIIAVPTPADRPRFDALAKELPEARAQLQARRQAAQADFDAWLAKADAQQIAALVPADGLVLHAPLSEGQGAVTNVSVGGQPRDVAISGEAGWQPGHVGAHAYTSRAGAGVELADAGDFERDQAFSVAAWVRPPKMTANGSILARMDDEHDYRGWDVWIENGRIGMHVISKWQDDALKVVAGDALKPETWQHVLVTYDGSSKAAGVKVFINGVPQEKRNITADKLKSTIKTTVPLKLAQRHTQSRVNDLGLADVRLYQRALSTPEAERLARGTRAGWLAMKPAADRNDAEKKELFDWWLPTLDRPYGELNGRVAALQAEEAAIRTRGTIAHVMQERGDEAMAFVLFRGEYDKRRDPVKPKTPDLLPPMAEGLPRNRLGFAQWLLKPDHPLTTRVTVNRFWQEVFGTGIVKTAGDFGAAGELPSHPELLDWLAIDFRENGWDMKRFFKQVVMSATYRQAAVSTPEKLEKDLANRLLSRGPRFRMDGEMIRDYALSTSGLLVQKIGGPSVKPYQPEGGWEAVAMIGSNTRDYRRDTGENLYRRSLYTFWKRSAPPASLEIFNAPNRETCAVRRERTNTPLQALVTLNDVQFVEAARRLAENTLRTGGADDDARIDFVARRLLCRPLRAAEVEVVRGSLNELRAYYQGHADDAKQLIAVGESKADANLDPVALAAWTMTINELLNLDEVLNK